MEVKQIYALLNECNKEVLGVEDLVKEDLTNLVDNGVAVFNTGSYDRYAHAMVDKIGKMVWVSRPYSGTAPRIMMDSFMWGSVIQKLATDLPESTINESFDLVRGTAYDGTVFNPANVYEKFFAKYVTFEIDRSITKTQMQSAFNSPAEMDGFISMIYVAIDNRFTMDMDALIMRTINNAIAQTVKASYGTSALSSKSTIKAINLLKEYNDAHMGSTLTANNCLESVEFMKYATLRMGQTIDRLKRPSVLFNIDGKERFTPTDALHVVLLSDFKRSSDVYLQSSTWHNEFTQLPNADTVAFWQGTGDSYDFADVSKIYVKTAKGDDVTVTGVLGVMFDNMAMGVTNKERWTNTQFVPKADFTNYFYKMKAGYFNATDENVVVFFVA